MLSTRRTPVWRAWLAALAALIAALLLLVPGTARAQTEVLFQSIGADTSRTFAHASLPGATGIDFSFEFAIAAAYPPEDSHILVVVFEWGPTATGPWTASPDNVKSVPGAMTSYFSSGVYHGPDDAPWVQIHFYAGGLMTVSGTFTHTSVVPEPGTAALWLLALPLLAWRRRRAAVHGSTS